MPHHRLLSDILYRTLNATHRINRINYFRLLTQQLNKSNPVLLECNAHTMIFAQGPALNARHVHYELHIIATAFPVLAAHHPQTTRLVARTAFLSQAAVAPQLVSDLPYPFFRGSRNPRKFLKKLFYTHRDLTTPPVRHNLSNKGCFAWTSG